MWAIMIGNALIELGWIAAMVFLIMNKHPVWAGFCLVLAFFSGYNFKNKKT